MPLGLATVAGFAVLTAGASIAAEQDHPAAIVELFQSQGCSSCPPANANVIALSDRPDLLTLSFCATFWDDLGWKDTFASPKYTDRQWYYARAFTRKPVFTPEVVVSGRGDVVGTDRGELKREARAEGSGPAVEIKGGPVTVGSGNGTTERADVSLVRYNPNIQEVPIKRSENGGRTLPHKNVVKELVKLGGWSGGQERYEIPGAKQEGLREAVLVQAGPGGAILASARN
jgi:hypothetical protein